MFLGKTFQDMAVSIFKKQNDVLLLKCLCKQRKIYSSVKRIKLFIFFIKVCLVTILTVITTIWKNEYASSLLTVINMAILVVTKYVENFTNDERKIAATIQQYFDVSCYNNIAEEKLYELNSIFVPSEIAKLIAVVKEGELDNLKNWYSDYSALSPEEQILFCQNENINWDSKLRKFYKRSIIVFSTLIIAGITFYGIISNSSFNNWITIVSFSLVILDCDINSIRILNNDIKRLVKIGEIKNEIEKQIEDNRFSNYEQIIELQNNLYEHRQNCFLIPDFVYKLKNRAYQICEDKAAEIIKAFN